MATALEKMRSSPPGDRQRVRDLAASIQYNLARGIAQMAVRAAERDGMKTIALSGGVAYNHAIRTTIEQEIATQDLLCITSRDYPLGDGCVSLGQCVYAGRLLSSRD
jgi:hydrogenase maturation protein HypF